MRFNATGAKSNAKLHHLEVRFMCAFEVSAPGAAVQSFGIAQHTYIDMERPSFSPLAQRSDTSRATISLAPTAMF